MKRYAIDWYMESTLNGPACNVTMMETPSGEWVRYEDAQPETQRLQKTLAVSVEHQLALATKFAALVAENERLKCVKVTANDVIREIIEQAHMAGQISAGIDPSFSNAQQYCDELFPPNT